VSRGMAKAAAFYAAAFAAPWAVVVAAVGLVAGWWA
jgi:hypothetical protein